MSEENGGAITKDKVVVFSAQERSLLSELYCRDKNFRVVCQIVLFTGVLYITSTIAADSITAQRFHWKALDHLDSLTASNLIIGILVWLSLQSAAFAVYPLFRLWMVFRSWFKNLVDMVSIILYLLTVSCSFVYVVWACTHFKMPQYLKMVVATEQVRLCMKSYSFIRENAYKVLYPWHKDDTSGPAVWYAGQMSPTVGSFRQYCYFLFAPTLLYRDHYPRSPGPIKLKAALIHLGLFLYSLAVFFQIFGMLPVESFHWTEVVLSILKGLPYGVVYVVIFNLCVIHSWMNLGAEMTRFGDRRFYEDWWFCRNYEEFYRKWNIVPYHFNHQYIYRDIRKVTNNKYLALFLLFLASSVVHEYVLGLGFGQVVPLLTLMFAGIGVVAIGVRLKGTFLLIFNLSVGLYIIFWNFALETKARKVCPREETFLDLFYPRLFDCIMKHSL